MTSLDNESLPEASVCVQHVTGQISASLVNTVKSNTTQSITACFSVVVMLFCFYTVLLPYIWFPL